MHESNFRLSLDKSLDVVKGLDHQPNGPVIFQTVDNHLLDPTKCVCGGPKGLHVCI